MPRKPRTSSIRLPVLQKSAHHRRRLFFEPLEERRLLAIDAALVADINNGGDSFPDRFAPYGSYVYFRADDGVTGLETWRTDGSTANLFADLHPAGNSDPNSFTTANGKQFFTATTPTTNREVWVTDGISVPQVFDVRPGAATSAPANLTSYSGELYFVENGGTGIGIWHTNGVAFPTLVPGTAGLNPSEMIVSGGKLFFAATPSAAPSYSRIYTYDGSTLQALDISGGGSYGPKSLIDLGGTVYFSGSRSSPASGEELFKVTGTTSVGLVMDINSGTPDSSPSKFTVAGSNLFFKANNGTATNLWKTSAGGTQKVTDPIGVTVPTTSTFAAIGNLLYFVGTSGSGTGIFTSDGTTITSLPLTIGMSPDQLTNVGGQLYFIGTKTGIGREVWYLNGSTPTLVKDIVPGSGSSFPDGLTAIGSAVYFLADDGVNGSELWIAKDFVSSAPQTISQDAGGNLVITDNVNGNDDITIQSDGVGGWTIIGVGANFAISGTVPAGITASGNTISIPASAGPSFGKFIFNTGGGSDKVTVKLDNLAKRVDYDGGESTSDNDRLVVQSVASYSSQTTSLTSTGGGDLDFGSDGSIEIHFANLEPVDTTGVTIANKIINLPAGSAATLKDYLSPNDGFMQLTFNGTGPEDEQFQNPSTSLTINATGGGTNLIQFQTPDNGFAPTTLNFTGSTAASDTFRLAAGFPGVLPNTSNVVLTSATLDLNNQNETIGSLAGSGAVTLGSGGLATGNSNSTSYSGSLSGTGGTLLKQGAGTLTLGGTSGYTGSTTVNAGTLLLNGSLTGSGAVNVNNSSVLGGTGSIAGAVNINNTARLAPGASPETLATGSVTLVSGTFFDVEIGGTSPGNGVTGYDQLIVVGGVSLGGATLNLIQFGGFAVNSGSLQTYTIIDNDGTSDAVIGTFAGLAEGAAVSYAGGTLYVSYAGGDGNDVVLSSQSLVQGTALADTFVLTGNGATFTLTRTNANGTVTATFSGAAPINILGAGADDLLTVDSTGASTDPIPAGGVFYDGQTQDFTSRLPNSLGDILQLSGAAGQTATYLPSATTNGAGTITVTGIGTVTFTGLEPIDLIGFGTVNVNFPGGNDIITLTNGFDAATGTLAALIVSGTTGGVGFEQVHLRNDGTVNIDTTSVNGVTDAVTITSANNTHGISNLSVNTGTGTDRIDVVGGITTINSVSLTSQQINLTGLINLTGAANINLDAGSGSIADLNGVGTLNISGTGIVNGTAAGNIELDTAVSTLGSVISNTGNVILRETNGALVFNVKAIIGNVTVSSNTGNLAIDTVVAGGSATLTATGGALTDSGTLNVAAVSLVATAASGIDLDVTTSSITASTTGAGSILLDETDGVTLTSVTTFNGSITVNAGGTVTATNVVNTTDASNVITIVTTAGDILANNIVAPGDTITLNAAGAIEESSGDGTADISASLVNLTAATGIGALGTIEINTFTNSNRGLTASVTGAGLVDLSDITGGMRVRSVTTSNGNITLAATSGDLIIESISAGSGGDVALTASGAISDGNAATLNVAGDLLLAIAATGISLDTTVNNVEATGGSGGVDIEETDGLIIGGVSVPVVGVSVTGGNISVAAQGNITVNEAVSNNGGGQITVTAGGGGGGGGGRIALEAAGVNRTDTFPFVKTVLESAGYTVDIVIGTDIDTALEISQYSAVLVGDSGHGSNDWNSFGQALETYVTNGGGFLASGWVPYFLSFQSGPGYSAMNNLLPVQATTDYQHQGSVIPSMVHPINSGVSPWTTGSFSNYGGPVKPGATVVANDGFGNAAAAVWDYGLGRVVHLSPNYLVSFPTYTGAQSQLDGSNSNALAMFLNSVAFVSGGVTNADLTLNANVSGNGNVTLNATSILQNSGTVSTTGSGTVDYNAGTGVITMANGTSATSGTGLISLDATGNIQLSLLQTGSAAGNAVTVTTTAGAITDADGLAALDISAVNGGAILSAATGVGASGVNATIEVQVVNLDVHNNTSGGIFVTDTAGGLTLTNLSGPTSVSGVGGNGVITALSPLTIAASATTSGGMTYTATDGGGAGDNLSISAGVAVTDTTAALTFNAGDDFVLTNTASISAATTATINIDFGNADGGAGAVANIFGALAAPGGAGLNGAADSDTFNVTGPTATALDGITAAVTVNGFAGTNTLNLNDSLDVSGDTATITHTTVEGLGGSTGHRLHLQQHRHPRRHRHQCRRQPHHQPRRRGRRSHVLQRPG
ncbi:MAG: hypothetical protein ACKVP0_24705, partial [Pirellulaceae bacterium]